MTLLDRDGAALDRLLAAHPQDSEAAIPEVLRASVARHQQNLARLLQSFRAAGMDEGQIETALTVVIDSYKHELLEAIRSLKASGQLAGEAI